MSQPPARSSRDSYHHSLLTQVEHEAINQHQDAADLVLWPRTPTDGDMQRQIREHTGSRDSELANQACRSRGILQTLFELYLNGALPIDFTLLDLACGDAIILRQVALVFSRAGLFGTDLLANEMPAHPEATEAGVKLFRIPLQRIPQTLPLAPFDVVMTLNTFRNWKAADLREGEQQLPIRIETWIRKHARYWITTLTDEAAAKYDRREIGPIGDIREQNARMWLIGSRKHLTL